MKNFNWALHAIALLAIAYLFMDNRSLKQSQVNKSGGSNQTENSASFAAYFYSDSLLSQLQFFKDSEAEFKKKQQNMLSELQGREEKLQREVQSLQKNAENMTRKEMEAAQKRLAGMERELIERKEKLSAQFGEETAEFNEALHKKVISYLKEFNADGKYKYVFSVSREGNIFYSDPSLDITADMVKALNDQYSK